MQTTSRKSKMKDKSKLCLVNMPEDKTADMEGVGKEGRSVES